ncbi:MAG: aminoglycoside 3'-phosphotransferase [Eubacteriales bacterium]|nr:aminoglycoside 3'-phosphotransferase [Eubacteriales bacterium]
MELPKALCLLLNNAPLRAESIGRSGDQVYRVESDPPCYLKISGRKPELTAEMRGYSWLAQRALAPRVAYFGTQDDRAYLLTQTLGGQMACAPVFLAQPRQIARALGAAMHRLHALPTAGAPCRELDMVLTQAEERVRAGLVDESDFDDDNPFSTAAQVLNYVQTHRPTKDVSVFTHGDFCLPNVFFDGDGLTGFLDLSRCGVADPYQDVALALRSLAYNLGSDAYADDLLRAYGLPHPDPEKLRYYRLLDELF